MPRKPSAITRAEVEQTLENMGAWIERLERDLRAVQEELDSAVKYRDLDLLKAAWGKRLYGRVMKWLK